MRRFTIFKQSLSNSTCRNSRHKASFTAIKIERASTTSTEKVPTTQCAKARISELALFLPIKPKPLLRESQKIAASVLIRIPGVAGLHHFAITSLIHTIIRPCMFEKFYKNKQLSPLATQPPNNTLSKRTLFLSHQIHQHKIRKMEPRDPSSTCQKNEIAS